MNRVSFTLEYIFRASPNILYKFFTQPECLVRWYCDSVDIEKDVYTFDWEGYEEKALLIESEEDSLLRFRWDDAEDEDEYWEFKVYKSEVTDETVLEISDFSDEDEIDDQKQLWDSQIERLRIATGG